MWPRRWLQQIEEQLKSDFTKTIFHIISLSFNITPSYSNQSTAWHLCLLIGSLIFISSEMRWETHWTKFHTHTHKYTHTPQREISWLLKYNYLTADCHLGRCLDRLFLSLLPPLCVCIFPYLLSLAIFSVLFFFSHQSSVFSETLLGRLHNVWCNLQVFSCCNFQRRLVRWIIKYAFVFPMK